MQDRAQELRKRIEKYQIQFFLHLCCCDYLRKALFFHQAQTYLRQILEAEDELRRIETWKTKRL